MAGKPSASNTRALAASQALGRTRIGGVWWRARSRSALSGMAPSIVLGSWYSVLGPSLVLGPWSFVCGTRTTESLAPKREHRIDAGRPPCGNVAGDQRDAREHGRDERKRRGIGRAHAEQQAGHHT